MVAPNDRNTQFFQVGALVGPTACFLLEVTIRWWSAAKGNRSNLRRFRSQHEQWNLYAQVAEVEPPPTSLLPKMQPMLLKPRRSSHLGEGDEEM